MFVSLSQYVVFDIFLPIFVSAAASFFAWLMFPRHVFMEIHTSCRLVSSISSSRFHSYHWRCLIRYEPTRALHSADAHLLEVPRSRLRTQGEKAFSSAAPRLWNNLPLAMRATDSLSAFKKQLKTLLFRRTFSL